jgi:DNA-binding NarL/FixJ family response regulator
MRILVADDHDLVRAALRALIADLPGVTQVLEAADGRDAVAIAKVAALDIVILDISMPRLNGLEAIGRLSKEVPATRIIVLSMHDGAEYVSRALQRGACGYVVKHAAPAELELALRAAACGEIYVSPAARHMVHRIQIDPSSLDQLTPRQREVLQLVAEGHTNREIAQTLGIGVKTVETHRMQLMKELDLHDVAGLVRYALEVGLVQVE